MGKQVVSLPESDKTPGIDRALEIDSPLEVDRALKLDRVLEFDGLLELTRKGSRLHGARINFPHFPV